MSYQVIARKYRPQTFQDLIGQEQITQTLRHALEGNRLHHAYLFSGVRGTGKTTTARLLAKGLNCHRRKSSEPCLTCSSCLEIASGHSMDVLEIDAASNTGVDNIRDVIINNIAMAPARDRYKVFVIDEVHMLSTSAFNALLKTLEEPPRHVIFILATTELHKVPETILSRCQQFEFRQIPTGKIEARLREIATSEGITIGGSALREIARAGAGSLRDAQSAFDQVIAYSGLEIRDEDVARALGLIHLDTLLRCTRAIAEKETGALLRLVEEIDGRGHDLRHFTRELMSCFRDLLLLQVGVDETETGGWSGEEREELRTLVPLFSEADLIRSFHVLTELEREIKDATQPRFHLEVGLVKLAQLRRLRSLDELLEQVTALSARLGLPGGGEPPPSGGGRGTPTVNRPVDRSGGTGRPASTGPRFADAEAKSAEKNDLPKPGPPPREVRPASAPPPPLPPPREATEARMAPTDLPDITATEPEDDFPPFDVPASLPPVSSLRVQSPPPASAPPPKGGKEVEAILEELQRINRGFILAALEEATQLTFQNGTLIASFARDDTFAKRIRESGTLFRTIGETLMGHPIRIEVRIQSAGPSATSPGQTSQEQLTEKAQRIPAVRQFLEEMRGEIVWVKEEK